jgi:hypothetical protein
MRATWLLLLPLCSCVSRPAPARDAAVMAGPSGQATAACDSVVSLLQPVKGVSFTRSEGPFEDPVYQRRFEGCRVLVVGSFKALGDEPPVDVVLHEKLAAEGWSEDYDYSADGPDGTDFAFRRDGVFCVVEGRWEGGVFEDDEPPPSDRYEVTVGCADRGPREGLTAGRTP